MFPNGIDGGLGGGMSNGAGMNGAPADLMWMMFTQTGYPGYYMLYSDVNYNEHDILE